jgi:hypothetical protein
MREKTDMLGRAGEIVDSANKMAAERRVAKTARNLQAQKRSPYDARSPPMMNTGVVHCPY